MRVCTVPGCPTLTRRTRCDVHQREYEQARGTRQQRGYGAEHDKLRAMYQKRMDSGQAYYCWRCGGRIDPCAWDLGHRDGGTYAGPECRPCNRSAPRLRGGR